MHLSCLLQSWVKLSIKCLTKRHWTSMWGRLMCFALNCRPHFIPYLVVGILHHPTFKNWAHRRMAPAVISKLIIPHFPLRQFRLSDQLLKMFHGLDSKREEILLSLHWLHHNGGVRSVKSLPLFKKWNPLTHPLHFFLVISLPILLRLSECKFD